MNGLDLDRGENPRKAETITVTVSGREHDTLVEAYRRLGGRVETLECLSEPSLSHNMGLDQTVRALVRGEISASDFDKPFPSPESSDENRWAKMNVAFTPAEVSSLEERSDRDDSMNHRAVSRKLRAVVSEFVEEVQG